MKPNQRLSSGFVVLDLLRLGHYPFAACLPTKVYIGYGISSSEKNFVEGEFLVLRRLKTF